MSAAGPGAGRLGLHLRDLRSRPLDERELLLPAEEGAFKPLARTTVTHLDRADLARLAAGDIAAAGGTVQFAADGTALGDPVALGVDGRATSGALPSTAGDHDITATYTPAAAKASARRVPTQRKNVRQKTTGKATTAGVSASRPTAAWCAPRGPPVSPVRGSRAAQPLRRREVSTTSKSEPLSLPRACRSSSL